MTLINNQIEGLRSELTEALTRKANFDAHLSRILEQDTQKNEVLENINKSIHEHRGQQEELIQSKEKLSNELLAIRAEKKRSQDTLTDLKQRIKYISNELDRVNKKISKYIAEHSRIRAEIDVLEQAENTFQGYTEGTKHLLSAMRENKLSGGQGSLIRYLTIPVHLETAIASVLGEYIDAFLLEDINGVEEALGILAQNSVRGVLLPVASVNPYAPLEELQNKISFTKDDLIGIASELVEVPESLRAVVDLLLGHVIVKIIAARKMPRRSS
jgi:chromosome segregation protein